MVATWPSLPLLTESPLGFVVDSGNVTPLSYPDLRLFGSIPALPVAFLIEPDMGEKSFMRGGFSSR